MTISTRADLAATFLFRRSGHLRPLTFSQHARYTAKPPGKTMEKPAALPQRPKRCFCGSRPATKHRRGFRTEVATSWRASVRLRYHTPERSRCLPTSGQEAGSKRTVPQQSTAAGKGVRPASDFGRMDFIGKCTALLSGRRLDYMPYGAQRYERPLP